jgi:TRAP-type C4-dicarboxylate transport system permease small subunit
MQKIERMFGQLTRYGDYVARIGVVALLALVVINVILRYSWQSIQGTYDYVQLITAVTVVLAVAYTAYERGHIEIEIFTERLPKRVQSGLAMVMMLICTGFFVVASWQSWIVGNSMKEANETSMSVFVPLYPFMWIMAIGLGLTALAFLLRALQDAHKMIKPSETGPAVESSKTVNL